MYNVSIINRGDYSFTVKSKDYQFEIDTKGVGISPPDTLLASLGSCIGVYIRKYAEGAKLDLGNFSMEVKADFSQDRPVRFKQIEVVIDLKGFVLDEHRKRAMLEFIKNCPVHNTIKSDPTISVEIAQ